MQNRSTIREYLKALENSDDIGDQVVFHKVYDETSPAFDTLHRPWPGPIARLLEKVGINRLFAHQVQTMNRVREGVHTVVATQTASGRNIGPECDAHASLSELFSELGAVSVQAIDRTFDQVEEAIIGEGEVKVIKAERVEAL